MHAPRTHIFFVSNNPCCRCDATVRSPATILFSRRDKRARAVSTAVVFLCVHVRSGHATHFATLSLPIDATCVKPSGALMSRLAALPLPFRRGNDDRRRCATGLSAASPKQPMVEIYWLSTTRSYVMSDMCRQTPHRRVGPQTDHGRPKGRCKGGVTGGG